MNLPPSERLLFKRVRSNETLIHDRLEQRFEINGSFKPALSPNIERGLSIYAGQLLSLLNTGEQSQIASSTAREAVYLSCSIAEIAGSELNTPQMTQNPPITSSADPTERSIILQGIIDRYENHFPLLTSITDPHLNKLHSADETVSEDKLRILRSISSHAFLTIEQHNIRLYEIEMALSSVE